MVPCTAPFSVCHVTDLLRVYASDQTPAPYQDASEAWLMPGAELGVEPTVPMSATIAAMSTSNAVGVDASANAGDLVVVPTASLTATGSPRILVLRV